MSPDPPAEATELADRLSAATDAARDEDADAVSEAVVAVRAALRTDVADDELRSRLRHGCEAVERTVRDEPHVAAAYLEAMQTRVREASAGRGNNGGDADERP
jgi:hypothetical protein